MNRITNYKKLQDSIVQWIKDYAQDNNIKSLVVGVSGGIDSAVVSTLCAMTGLPIICCFIDIHNNRTEEKFVIKHVGWLNSLSLSSCRYLYTNYSDTLDTLIDRMSISFGKNALICANTKSRYRMLQLYHIAGSANGIVVGTGNKVEDFGVGFFTKYGDGGVDISPIADLYKSEVRELGRYMGISQEVLDAAPTDGLWTDGRTDEDQIGCSYEILEWCMEYGNGVDEYTEEQLRAMRIYKNLNTKNRHKMIPIPTYKLILDDTTA